MPTYGAFTDPGFMPHFAVSSGNGISAFHLSAGVNATIEGNTSIDNLRVAAIHEPVAWIMVGFALFLGFRPGRIQSLCW